MNTYIYIKLGSCTCTCRTVASWPRIDGQFSWVTEFVANEGNEVDSGDFWPRLQLLSPNGPMIALLFIYIYLYILTLLHYSKWTQINGSSQIPTLKHIRATLFYLHIPFTINLTYTNMWSRPPHVRGQTIFIFALCFIRLPNQDLLRNMDIPPYFIINITNNSKLFCISLSLSLSLSMFFSS